MEIRELTASGFKFKKSLGQNFIGDKNLLRAIAKDACVTETDTVVEIGAGAGTLTRALAEKAKKVVAFEVDTDLDFVLNEVKKDCKNVNYIFADVLKLTDQELRVWVTEPFKVVANLPYYVTTPMIMRFVESTLSVTEMTVMMQKEVADRLIAKEDTPEYGAITVSLQAISDVSVVRTIDRRMFYPVPNVDSALVKIVFNRNKYDFADYGVFKRVAKSAFAMRRKTLANNLIGAFNVTKTDAEKLIESLGYPKTVRGETLSVNDLVKLANLLAKK